MKNEISRIGPEPVSSELDNKTSSIEPGPIYNGFITNQMSAYNLANCRFTNDMMKFNKGTLLVSKHHIKGYQLRLAGRRKSASMPDDYDMVIYPCKCASKATINDVDYLSELEQLARNSWDLTESGKNIVDILKEQKEYKAGFASIAPELAKGGSLGANMTPIWDGISSNEIYYNLECDVIDRVTKDYIGTIGYFIMQYDKELRDNNIYRIVNPKNPKPEYARILDNIRIEKFNNWLSHCKYSGITLYDYHSGADSNSTLAKNSNILEKNINSVIVQPQTNDEGFAHIYNNCPGCYLELKKQKPEGGKWDENNCSSLLHDGERIKFKYGETLHFKLKSGMFSNLDANIFCLIKDTATHELKAVVMILLFNKTVSCSLWPTNNNTISKINISQFKADQFDSSYVQINQAI